MAVKSVEWDADESAVQLLDPADLFSADGPDESESDLEDSASAIWPCGEFLQDVLPPAPGRCRRVPHDW
jgi:hypothetical protein